MCRDDSALVGAEDPTFEQADNAMYAGHGNVRRIARRGKDCFLVYISMIWVEGTAIIK
jgi:hypothetical protein